MNYLFKYFFPALKRSDKPGLWDRQVCISVFLTFFTITCFSQNECSKWVFGQGSGLDFMTSPPTIGTYSNFASGVGCASVADAAGNLLFYTNGSSIFNQAHQTMANGSGLTGGGSVLIAKRPGSSTLYYVLTLGGGTLYYSIVDMSLSAGMGSVTVLNTSVSAGNTAEKLTGTRHCNGRDFWIVTHSDSTNNFYSFLLSSSGLNSTPVVSAAGTAYQNSAQGGWLGLSGFMKISPNGKKLGTALYGFSFSPNFELFDFDNSTGIVSNAKALITGLPGPYGCEFSPDGTKFYGSLFGWQFINIYQWDLCTLTGTANIPSLYTYSMSQSTNVVYHRNMQLAPDGKIYVGRSSTVSSLGVINSPNLAGSSFSFVLHGQSISTTLGGGSSVPNFMNSSFIPRPVTPPFTFTVNNGLCQNASFTAPPIVYNMTTTACSVNGYSLTNLLWNFGDPASGASNTSTINNPTHVFSSQGTYTTMLILYYTCTGGTDTLRQVVNISQPCVTVNSTSITCANLGSATVTPLTGTGPYSYTWIPTNQNGAVVTGLSPGTYTIMAFDPGNNYTYSTTTVFTSPIPLTGTLNNASNLTCPGATNGTANVTNFAGGSGTVNYVWTNSVNSYTAASPQNLGAGQWSVTVTDVLTGCQVFSVFTISQPPALTLSIAANTPSVCLGGNIVLTGTASGGTPGYGYNWYNGPPSHSFTVTENTAGPFLYTLSAVDGNSCAISNTVTIDFIVNPVLSINSVSICPLETGTLTVSGASTYLWNTSATTNSIYDAPLATTAYSVVGSAFGCTAAATGSIIVKPLPTPLIGSNSPRCNNDNLTLYSLGGSSYLWAGPLSFTSSLQNPVINPIGLAHAGVYNLTVTAANSCTRSVSTTVVVIPTPTISATGATVCTVQNATLSAGSLPGSSYQWSGPLGYSSAIQNPVLVTPALSASGQYTVKATSPVGCTTTAFANILVIPPPSLTAQLSSHSLCSQALNGSPNTITLTAGGADTYSLVTVPDLFNANPGGPVSPLSAIPPNAGVASATLSGSNGVCTLTLGLTFTIIPNPTVSVNNYTPEICAGQSFTYTNFGANSYTWNGATPNFTTYHNGGVAVANPSINSVFSVYGGSLGCNSASRTSTITVHPIPTVLVTPPEASICLGTSASLTAQGTATSFTWQPFVGLNQQTGAQVIASPLVNQTYTVTGSANNCTNTAVADVTVLKLPQPGASASKPAVCELETVTLTGNGGESYHWHGPGNFSYGGKIVSFKPTVHHSGIYTLTVKDVNGCVNSTITSVQIIQLPQGSLGAAKMQGCVPFCSDYSYRNPSSNASHITASWQVDSKTYTGKTFNHCFTNAGDHIIAGIFEDTLTGCNNTQTFVVQAYPVPVAGFRWLPEKPIEGQEDVLFLNSSEGEKQESFYWSFIDNQNYKSKNENTSYSFREAGNYPVAFIVRNTYGCSDSIVKVVTIEPDFNFYVPNAFTPNADDRNDVFIPVVRGVKQYDLKIFNRWGDLVFHSTDLSRGWDGMFNSEECKQDVYVWKVVLSTLHGETKEYAGHVTLYK